MSSLVLRICAGEVTGVTGGVISPPNGLSITSGGRWLVPFLTESDPDSDRAILLSLVSRPTGGFVFACE